MNCKVKIMSLLACLLLVVFLGSCGSSNKRTIPKSEAQPQLTAEECYAEVSDAVAQIYPDNSLLSLEENLVRLEVWQEDLMPGFRKAKSGDATYVSMWDETMNKIANLSGVMHQKFDSNGYPDIYCLVCIVDPDNHSNPIYMAMDGSTVYDPVNHVDRIGLGQSREEILEDAFAGIVEGATVKASDRFSLPQVTILTDLSVETKPQDWDEIVSAVASNFDEITGMDNLVVMVNAKDDTILLNVTNGKVMYDLYGKRGAGNNSEAPVTRSSASEYSSFGTGQTVYVTPSGSHYHYSSNCNGGSYSPTSLSNAISRGLTPCGKCAG